MSAASRQREYSRRYLCGFPTLPALRAAQATALPTWLQRHMRPSLIAANQAVAFFAWEDGRHVAFVAVPDDSPPFV